MFARQYKHIRIVKGGNVVAAARGYSFIDYRRGDDSVTLDGDFIVEELEEIIHYMKSA